MPYLSNHISNEPHLYDLVSSKQGILSQLLSSDDTFDHNSYILFKLSTAAVSFAV